MRDYKNLNVPKKYRAGAKPMQVRRVEVKRTMRTSGTGAIGQKKFLLHVFVSIMLIGSVFLSWQGYRLLTRANIFQISGVDVRGVRQLGEAELKAIADIFTGQNIFRVDLDAAARRALANPWVKEVRINRNLPNRISMTFTERVPRVVLDTGPNRYLVDSDGVVIVPISKETPSAWPLPVIELKDYRARPGELISHEAIREALSLLTEISARGDRTLADVTIRANSRETISIVNGDNEIKIGTGNYREKLRRLAEVTEDMKGRGLNIAYVDLRPENQAALMIKSEKGTGKIPNNKRKITNKHQ